MRRPTLAAALAALAFSAPAVAQEAAPAQLAYSVWAPDEATYDLECRFRAVRLQGRLANNLTLSGKGPQKGRLPTDNARCTLAQTSAAGPVGFAVVKDKPYAAGVARQGQSAKVLVP